MSNTYEETLHYIADLQPGDVIVSNEPGEIVVKRQAPPVPPLPTEPDTVIRARWGETTRRLIRDSMGWQNVDTGDRFDVERITGFEVLASPKFTTGDWEHAAENAKQVRRETATAVLDRLSTLTAQLGYAEAHEVLNSEFGVDS